MPEVVTSLKSKGVQAVGVWLTLQGYWWGIDPESPLVEKYDCVSHKMAREGQPRGGVVVLEAREPVEELWMPSPGKALAFWHDWFTEMKSWGIDFVKAHHLHMHLTTS